MNEICYFNTDFEIIAIIQMRTIKNKARKNKILFFSFKTKWKYPPRQVKHWG